ncbi:MAG: hypothetical protein LH478_04615 [Chitinophagaceae bacterium]|nr:hypothetical protein [Chitinophagaceae bacterium]
MEDNKSKVQHADVDESNRHEWEKTLPNAANTNFGSGPSGPIADGGGDGKKQPKEKTGKDSTMGGADGGTAGMGYSKEIVEQQTED